MATDHGYVLLHGACLGGWLWERLEPQLDGPTLALDLPGRGASPADPKTLTLDAAVDTVIAQIRDWGPSRVTVAAHSMGGIFGLAIGARAPELVERLVFVSAVVPEHGKPMLSAMPPSQRLMVPFLLRFRPQSLKPPAGGVRRSLGNDLDEATTAWVAERVVAEMPAYYRDPVQWDALPATLPRCYVKTLNDQSGISETRQDRMAANLGTAAVTEIESGHLPMLSKPDQLAAVLNDRG